MSNMAVINYENAEEQKTYSTVEVFFYFLISTACNTRLI